MKLIKTILIILASLVVIGFIIIAFMPSERIVEKSIVVATAPEKPFSLINDVTKWSAWSPWYALDTTQTITYGDITAGTGASYSWSSEHKYVRSGTLTVLSSNAPDSIWVGLEFSEWDPGKAVYYFEKVGENETKVTERMVMTATNFMGKFGIFMGASMLEKSFEDGLAKIKELAEAMPDAPVMPGKIENMGLSEMAAMNFMAITDTVKMEMMHEFFNKVYGEVMVQAGMQELEVAGDAFARVDEWNPAEGYAVFTAGFPFKTEGKAGDRVMPGKSEKMKVVSVDFYGPAANSELAHTAIDNYINANGMEIVGAPFEFYPETENMDPQNMHIRVCYPVNEKASEPEVAN